MVATANFRIKSGDTLPVIRVVLESRNNKPIRDEDLTHLSTVTFKLFPIAGGAASLTDDGALIDAGRSEFGYDWSSPAGTAGWYHGFFVLVFDNGKQLTVPNADEGDDMFLVEITS